MVSILEGQLTRTWNYIKNDQIHVISLYHDPMTGVRSATLDHEEIIGSLGNSSLLMEAIGHRILFSIRGTPGYIEIKRSGWFGFIYSCNIGGENQIEITQQISQTQGQEVYDVKILEHVSASDGYSEEMIIWYYIETTRLSDGLTNTVHRRFKDFTVLNSDIREHFKGHHLKSSLPDLPEKRSKLTTDHTDPVFLQQRETQLQSYLISLVRVPHVADMISMKAFLGLMDKVRETSIVFKTPTLGLTLIPCESPGSPAVIGFVQNTELCASLTAGDIVSKINGSAVGSLTFDGVVRMLKHLPRPIVVHFAQTLACPESESSREAKKRQTSWKGDLEPNRPHLPSFSADDSENTPLSTLLNSPSSQTQLQSRTISKSQQLKSNSRDGEYVSFT
mmetsp:Transcript_22746/g.23402  ORF Transcript_22746/g.23402 Transcript_22746/m.23402 type:complete len:391 (+) Transcript_22746:106-1278(+)